MKTAVLTIFLLGLLAIVGWWVISSVSSIGGFQMPAIGWVAMVVGIIVAVALGVGLMALSFHSNRAGHDLPPDYDNWPQPPDERAGGGRGPSPGA